MYTRTAFASQYPRRIGSRLPKQAIDRLAAATTIVTDFQQEPSVSQAELSKEQQIIRAMRKTLTAVVRDCAPRPGQPSPLAEPTVENIRMCLGLIAARESELAEALGLSRNERPYYTDTAKPAEVLQFVPPSGRKGH